MTDADHVKNKEIRSNNLHSVTLSYKLRNSDKLYNMTNINYTTSFYKKY